MITITFIPKSHTIKFKGHAGSGDVGKDIVCAAASYGFYNLLAVLREYPEEAFKSPLKYQEATGKKKVSYVKAVPTKNYEVGIDHEFYYAMVGFETLANNYPQYVTLEVAES